MVQDVLTVGIDEVGYGPTLGPLVVAAAASLGPLPRAVRIADSKKVFSQARGVETLEPAVLGFVPAPTFADLVDRLSSRLPDAPWYAAPLPLPRVASLRKLAGAWARVVDPSEFNAATRTRNKSDFLFEIAAGLIREIRAEHRGPIRFIVGKQGGRQFYLRGLQQQVSSTVMVTEETRRRSAYQIPGATIEFLMDAEGRHKLVALASMIGKYVRECAMKLFNEWWASRVEGLRRTAGYGVDARRFYREIEPSLAALNIAPDSVLRLR
jgi:ribonuclease HII